MLHEKVASTFAWAWRPNFREYAFLGITTASEWVPSSDTGWKRRVGWKGTWWGEHFRDHGYHIFVSLHFCDADIIRSIAHNIYVHAWTYLLITLRNHIFVSEDHSFVIKYIYIRKLRSIAVACRQHRPQTCQRKKLSMRMGTLLALLVPGTRFPGM